MSPGSGTDHDSNQLLDFMQRALKLHKMSITMVEQAIATHSKRNIRNEPREWLESLEWDKRPRLTSFFQDAMGVKDNPYVQSVGHNFWVSMVARIYRPGCQVDNMVYLIGKQGIFKTSALRAIGGKWYTEAHASVTDKDFYLAMQGAMLIEIAELDAFTKADANTLKKVVSCKVDRYRTPYGRITQDHPRQCIFAGTTNDPRPIREFGARRAWPLHCNNIDLGMITELREQYFAEAVHRFKQGEPWWEVPVDETRLAQENAREMDELEGMIGEWLEGSHFDGPREETTLQEVFDQVVKTTEGTKMSMREQRRIATILRTLGWEQAQVRKGERVRRVWRPLAQDWHSS